MKTVTGGGFKPSTSEPGKYIVTITYEDNTEDNFVVKNKDSAIAEMLRLTGYDDLLRHLLSKQ